MGLGGPMKLEQVCSERTESVLFNASVQKEKKVQKNETISEEYPKKQDKCSREHESDTIPTKNG